MLAQHTAIPHDNCRTQPPELSACIECFFSQSKAKRACASKWLKPAGYDLTALDGAPPSSPLRPQNEDAHHKGHQHAE
jgi:hypothetical protein